MRFYDFGRRPYGRSAIFSLKFLSYLSFLSFKLPNGVCDIIMKRLPQIPRPHQQWLFDPDGAEVMGFYPTRRLRIICLMCQDTDTADIATELNISMPSLLCYRAAILEKAGVKTHTGLVFWAVKEGLVR